MNKEKIDEIISTVKLNDLLHKKEKEEKSLRHFGYLLLLVV